ncbi:MAG TPA: hypothetical protein VMX17_05145 [Candidatus Glassbacteria bacterium]|nr:hypothetical protein [Candidatus Glassbacteria bacterium]
MLSPTDIEKISFINDKKWRMNNLYRIVDKNGNSIRFRLNEVQQNVLENLHTRNLILKARQLGMSTFSVLYLLDEAIFNKNTSCGIVSYSLEHSQHIFKRIIGHAIDSLTPKFNSMAQIVQRSAREITFANGSYLRVDTTLRGGSYQLILVSEFGKTCARNPLKADEVITGTLQTVPSNGKIIIESTGEGNSGFYADMVNNAVIRGNNSLSDLEYKLFFFPWYLEKNYIEKQKINYDVDLTDYFNKIESDSNVIITQEQRSWYAIQSISLVDKMKQEFPSTVSEAFLSSSDAYYFQKCIESAYNDHRMLNISTYDPLDRVYIAMDIGVNDLTVIVFFQCIHGEIRIIDMYADNGKGVDFYCYHLQQEKRYIYHTIFLPHDSRKRDGIVVENTYEREFRKLFSHTETKIVVLKLTDKNINISNAKNKFSRCVFDLNKTKTLIDMLNKYRKKWSEQFGKYLDTPLHDVSSNYSDAMQYAMQAVTHIESVSNSSGALEAHKKVVESRRLKF